MKTNGLGYAHDLLALIAAAVGKSFYWIAGVISPTIKNPMDNLQRDWIGGMSDKKVKTASLENTYALLEQGRPEGITLLSEVNKDLTVKMISGLKNGPVITVINGWDEGQEIDLMLALIAHFSLFNNVIFKEIVYNYETIPERDFGITPFETLHGQTAIELEEGINKKRIVVKTPLSPKRKFEIQHIVTTTMPFNGVDLRFETDRPAELAQFIAENTGFTQDLIENNHYVTYHPKDDFSFQISAIDSKNK